MAAAAAGRTRGRVAVQRVAAAGVGPDAGEGDLAGGALLQQQLALGREEEHGESAVQQAPRLPRLKPAAAAHAGVRARSARSTASCSAAVRTHGGVAMLMHIASII